MEARIAAEQAKVMGAEFQNMKIDLPGDGPFLDRFVNAVSLGKSLDAGLASATAAACGASRPDRKATARETIITPPVKH